MQTQAVVADAHLPCRKLDVLQGGVTFRHEREVAFNKSRLSLSTHNLIGGEAAQPDKPAVVHDALELFAGFQELGRGFPVQLLGMICPRHSVLKLLCIRLRSFVVLVR